MLNIRQGYKEDNDDLQKEEEEETKTYLDQEDGEGWWSKKRKR